MGKKVDRENSRRVPKSVFPNNGSEITTWSYGVTTVNSRISDTLPATLRSLSRSGFGNPTLFIDGPDIGVDKHSKFLDEFGHLDRVARGRNIKTVGNWWLSFWELYARNPHADRYALFQDDLAAVNNLREYLEKIPYPDSGYLNLYTFPLNMTRELLPDKTKAGFYKSNQLGKGAVGLVFDQNAAQMLLRSSYMVNYMKRRKTVERHGLKWPRGCIALDGAIVEAMKLVKISEYVHNPSLLKHTGIKSSMGNNRHAQARSFPGEDFDAMNLVDYW